MNGLLLPTRVLDTIAAFVEMEDVDLVAIPACSTLTITRIRVNDEGKQREQILRKLAVVWLEDNTTTAIDATHVELYRMRHCVFDSRNMFYGMATVGGVTALRFDSDRTLLIAEQGRRVVFAHEEPLLAVACGIIDGAAIPDPLEPRYRLITALPVYGQAISLSWFDRRSMTVVREERIGHRAVTYAGLHLHAVASHPDRFYVGSASWYFLLDAVSGKPVSPLSPMPRSSANMYPSNILIAPGLWLAPSYLDPKKLVIRGDPLNHRDLPSEIPLPELTTVFEWCGFGFGDGTALLWGRPGSMSSLMLCAGIRLHGTSVDVIAYTFINIHRTSRIRFVDSAQRTIGLTGDRSQDMTSLLITLEVDDTNGTAAIHHRVTKSGCMTTYRRGPHPTYDAIRRSILRQQEERVRRASEGKR